MKSLTGICFGLALALAGLLAAAVAPGENRGLFLLSIGISAAGVLWALALWVRTRRLFSGILGAVRGWDFEDPPPSGNDELLQAIATLMATYARHLADKNSVSILDKEAQIGALQAQINPHFLYNTLESIRGQARRQGNADIARMAEALGLFFRYNIDQKDYLVTLRDELRNVDNYHQIQNYRFDGMFEMEVEVAEGPGPDVMEYRLPKLTLQPIVENAIYHGLETKGERGRVRVLVQPTDQRLYITVSDDGVGLEEDALERLNRTARAGRPAGAGGEGEGPGGVALVNVNRRIQLLFGAEYGLQVYSTPRRGTDVEITLPLVGEGAGRGPAPGAAL